MDIYDSMAKGVQGAQCVVAFMTQRYQESENCMLELKFAKQSKVPIIPVVLQGDGWSADDWLGLITAGALWTPLCDEQTFESGADSLHEQICKTAPATSTVAKTVAKTGDASGQQIEDLRQQIEDLRRQVAAPVAPRAKKENDKNALAPVPADVPPLADNFQGTPDMETLKELLLDNSSTSVAVSSMGGRRVGAFGERLLPLYPPNRGRAPEKSCQPPPCVFAATLTLR